MGNSNYFDNTGDYHFYERARSDDCLDGTYKVEFKVDKKERKVIADFFTSQ